MKSPIHSKKHYVQISQATISQAAVLVTDLVTAIESHNFSTPSQVGEGASVKAVYVEYWLGTASATVVGSYTFIIYKDPGAGQTISAAEMAALHDYPNKKNILFTSQALSPPTDGGLIPVIKGWVKIPKGKQRMGLSDKISIACRNNNATAIDLNICGFAIYKDYM